MVDRWILVLVALQVRVATSGLSLRWSEQRSGSRLRICRPIPRRFGVEIKDLYKTHDTLVEAESP